MNRHNYLISTIAAVAITFSSTRAEAPLDTMGTAAVETVEAIAETPPDDRYTRLTDEDYQAVADELGIEVAAIKAVVDIETGRCHQGFASPGRPLINFDLAMFKRFAKRRGVNLSKFKKSHAVVFARPNTKRYGSYQNAQHARLEAARKINNEAAIEGTFWGMFQIGGFNWKKCGAESLDDFVERMSQSEREQLELFASFIENSGMTKYLKAKNWSAFALRYNGTSYRSRGYHTRLAKAYAKHLKNSK